MPNPDHYARMENSDYHKNGGCVVRHVSHFAEGNKCSHRGQAYKTSKKSRKKLYNSYDPSSIEDIPAIRGTWIDDDGEEKGFHYRVSDPRKDPTCWFIGKGENFKHSSRVPYLHNAHHILTNGKLNESFNIEYDGHYRNVLIYLMAEKYNINDGKNMIILPKEKKISAIIQLPYHCPGNKRSHPEYSKYVGSQLKDMAMELKSKFEDLTCTEKRITVKQLKKDLQNLSIELFDEIVAIGKKETAAGKIAGTNIEKISE